MTRLTHLDRWFVWTIAIIIMVAILLLGAIQRFSIEQDILISEQEIVYSVKLRDIRKNPPIDISDWKNYHSDKYQLEFKYPLFGEKQDITLEKQNNDAVFNIAFWSSAEKAYFNAFTITLSKATPPKRYDASVTLAPDHHLDLYGYDTPQKREKLLAALKNTVKFSEPGVQQNLDTSTWKTHQNGEHKFEIKYPPFIEEVKIQGKDFVSMGFFSECYKDDILCLQYPRDHLSDVINFEGAAIVIQEKKSILNNEICKNFSDQNTTSIDTKIINGVTFYTTDHGEGGGGHTFGGIRYRTYHDRCYEIRSVINTYRCDGHSIIDPKTNIKYCDDRPMLDRQVMEKELEQIISTFKFFEPKAQ